MFLHIERGSSVPISRQIAEQIRAQCLSGQLPAGEKLPSVRELALQLAVNVNTVFRVYERLAAEKILEVRQGDGTYVAAPDRDARSQLTSRREKFFREFEAAVRQGVLLGITPAELRAKLAAVLKQL